ncbi:hypothetical protein, partial [Erythrobacter sp. YJ-T3-07]|uniref:hypothetical protein n=1 Tax=Erythrobacter sp. YJ-T3-07 TaxID=2793063 RepID=UPI001F30C34F
MENLPFQYNNYIYKVELLEPATAYHFSAGARRPGTTAPPEAGVSTLILRLSNPRAEGLNNTNRVQNEVATQLLFRKSLSEPHPELERILPAIYAWEPCKWTEESDEADFGWTMIQYMPGNNL